MVLVKIEQPEVFPLDERLTGFSLEAPTAGATSDVYEVELAVWVVARSGPVSAMQIRPRLPSADVFYRVMKRPALLRLPVDRVRLDVATHYSLAEDFNCGFAGTIGVVGSPLQFEWLLEAVLDDGAIISVCAIQGRREAVSADFQPAIQPVLVTNLGRCGSTLLMQCLAAHRQIVAQQLYPYETRAAGYWMHALAVLSAPANHLQSSHPNSYQHNPFWVGSHPHHMSPLTDAGTMRVWFGRDYCRRLADLFMQTIEEFYRRVASSQSLPGPRFFAEKAHAIHTSQLMSELYPLGREVFLVRDFRDMLCSMRSWYRKQGLVSFGLDAGGSDEFLLRWQYNAQLLLNNWKARSSRAHLLRYEDLITRPLEVVSEIYHYLGLDTSASDTAAAVANAFRQSKSSALHQTATSPASSIGRWKTELNAAEQEACQWYFSDVLQEFGYAE